MTAYSDAIVAESGLVYYLTLGESAGTTATDLSPSPYNGAYSATGVTYGQPGIPGDTGTSILENGAGTTFVNVAPTVPAKLQVNDVWSMECWVKRTALSGTNLPTLWSETSANGSLVRFTVDADAAGGNRIRIRKFGVADAMTSTVAVTVDGNWHHIVVTKNGGTAVMWLDNANVSGTYTPQTMVSPATSIARRVVGGTDQSVTGYLQHFALYNVALTSTQVAAHYALGSSAPAVSPVIQITRSNLRLA